MQNANLSKLNAVLSAVLLMAACGGGGGSAPPAEPPLQNPSTLNGMQLAFEASLQASGGGQHHLYAVLPAAGLPAPQTHHAFALQYTLNDALTESAQKLGATPTPISPSLPLPDFATWTPVRVLMEGRIVVEATLPNNADVRVRLHGDTARIHSMALDGTTIASATRVTSFEAFPLSGVFTSAPAEVRNWPALAPLSTNALLLKPEPLRFSPAPGTSSGWSCAMVTPCSRTTAPPAWRRSTRTSRRAPARPRLMPTRSRS